MDKYEDFKSILPNWVNPENFDLYKMRHTAEHVLHLAVSELYPEIRRAMGPPIEEGFYFDFDPNGVKITEEDLPKIEAKMKEIVNKKLPMVRAEISGDKAKELFKDNPYKLEWIEEFADQGKTLTVYWTGDPESDSNADADLCKGPHVENTKDIGVFKLLSIAGAYWRGDEKNKMLTRIYATTFKTQEELDQYIWQKEEAKKRDHRKLGKELDLFTFSELVGSGLPLYTQRGSLIRRLLNNFVEELQTQEGYQQVWTPQIARAELFKTSGHYDKYKADMFRVVSNYSEEEMFLKPMNCPQHTQIYASQLRSYKDLPIRMTDFAMLYRDERPGELHGLARVRSFSQDDCHIFCREDQVDEEIDRALSMTKKIMETFGFKYKYRLSTRDPQHPEKYYGDPKIWDKVEKWAVEIMERNKIDYFDGPGEAAFYAPKMDLMATDSLGREWQLSTVQIDYVQPERFKLKYIDSDGTEKTPIMIHRAILGSAERMMMVLLETFAGAFPAWLAPDQVMIVPISEEQNNYSKKLSEELQKIGIRVVNNDKNEKMQSKIRDGQNLKIPYMLIVGKREESENQVSLRYRDQKENVTMSFEDFKSKILENISQRKLDIHF